MHGVGSGINVQYSGSTAVVSMLQGRRLTTAWVGDSKAVLARQVGGAGPGRMLGCFVAACPSAGEAGEAGRSNCWLCLATLDPAFLFATLPCHAAAAALPLLQDPRGCRAICLTRDHKPQHPEERARIMAGGGRVER
jgi:hypothetical protein